MWRSGRDRSRNTVVCIACGSSVPREDAREYDKEGDRWEREGKRFEHLCKACHGELSHHPRDGLEALLADVQRDGLSQREFLHRYLARVDERSESTEEPES